MANLCLEKLSRQSAQKPRRPLNALGFLTHLKDWSGKRDLFTTWFVGWAHESQQKMAFEEETSRDELLNTTAPLSTLALATLKT